MHVVVPGGSSDLYLRHQRIWEAVSAHARTGKDFLFWQSTPGLFIVRGKRLPDRFSRPARLLNSGHFELDMIAVRRQGSVELPVSADDLADWFQVRADDSGFTFSLDTAQPLGFDTGTKFDHETGKAHRIKLPVARFTGHFEIADRLKAETAFAEGLGRGRRFGYGMLRFSA